MGNKVKKDLMRSCAHKIRHPSAVTAGKHAERLFQAKGDWVRIYQCRHCGGYHVGH